MASALDAIEHTSVVFVVTEYAEGDVAVPLDGSGFLVPRQVGAPVTAVSWASSKWERLRQPGTVLLRSSLGHRDADDVIDASDDAIIAAVQTAHRRTMGIDTPPRRVRIVRYRDAFPQYDVGHLDRIAALDESLLRDAPHVALCGMAFGGVGIPACIRRARTEAGRRPPGGAGGIKRRRAGSCPGAPPAARPDSRSAPACPRGGGGRSRSPASRCGSGCSMAAPLASASPPAPWSRSPGTCPPPSGW